MKIARILLSKGKTPLNNKQQKPQSTPILHWTSGGYII